MAISNTRRGFNMKESGGSGRAVNPPQRNEKPDTSIFRGERKVSAQDLRSRLRGASPTIPGAGGAMYNLKEREGLANEIIKKYGSQFEKNKFEHTRLFRDLSRERDQARTTAEKTAIDRKIRYLKREIKGKGK